MKSYILIFFALTSFFISSCTNDVNEETETIAIAEPVVQDTVVSKPIEKFNYSQVEKIDKFFSYRNKIGRFNGTVLFADGNKIFKKAYGYSNIRNRDSLNVSTSFQLASVSKPITAIATLILEEQGKLSLSDSVQKFIPDFPYKGITIEQLLSHRSGLGNYIYWTEEYWPSPDSLMTNDDVLRLMLEHAPKMYYRPNQRYNYNNTNYVLLACIIERISGQKFDKFLQDNIFQPLDMKNSFLYTRKNFEKYDAATGYKNKRVPYTPFFQDGVHGDKSLYSSVEDLYKLDQALRNGKILSDTTLANAYTNRSKSFRRPYGLETYNGKTIIYHHGWWRGFKSYFIRSLEDDKTIIVLTNMVNGSKLNNDMLLDLFDSSENSISLAHNNSTGASKKKA